MRALWVSILSINSVVMKMHFSVTSYLNAQERNANGYCELQNPTNKINTGYF